MTKRKINSATQFKENSSWFDQNIKPASDTLLNALADELEQWGKNGDSWKICDFYLEKGIARGTWYRWIERSERLRLAMEITLERIGSRREKAALFDEANASITLASLAKYDPDHKEMMIFRAELNRKEQDNGGTKVVVIEKFPDQTQVTQYEGNNEQ